MTAITATANREPRMDVSTAPDVDRVLNRMGRSAFAYRSFPNPVDDLPPLAPIEPEPPPPDPAPALFSLVGAALPEAARAEVPRVPPPAAPVAVPAPVAAAVPPTPFAPDVRPPAPHTTSLSHMFRVLSAHAAAPRPRRDAGPLESAFPFRRR